jgi:hypothetical protein
MLPAAAVHVFDNFYSTPYDKPAPGTTSAYYMDWHPVHSVNRPNHGLGNAVRKALLVPLFAEAYGNGYKGGAPQGDWAFGLGKGDFNFAPGMVATMQATAARSNQHYPA